MCFFGAVFSFEHVWAPRAKKEKEKKQEGSQRGELVFRGHFVVTFWKQREKDAPAESLGARHVFSDRLGRFLDPRNLDRLAPAQADHVFPFPAPSIKRNPF